MSCTGMSLPADLEVCPLTTLVSELQMARNERETQNLLLAIQQTAAESQADV